MRSEISLLRFELLLENVRYGHLTWEWKKGIRSYLHPVIFAALYKVLAFLRLDTPWFMVLMFLVHSLFFLYYHFQKLQICCHCCYLAQIRSPRLLQSIFATICDLYVYKFSRVLFGGSVADWAVSFAICHFYFLFWL